MGRLRLGLWGGGVVAILGALACSDSDIARPALPHIHPQLTTGSARDSFLIRTPVDLPNRSPITWSQEYLSLQSDTGRADLVVEGAILLELKALPQLEPSHVAQTLNALKATGLPVALLLNFGPKPAIKRLIGQGAASGPRHGRDQRSSA